MIKKNITFSIIGFGYVGMSNALMLSKKFKVNVYDIDNNKVNNTLALKKNFSDQLILKYINRYKKNIINKNCIDQEILDSNYTILALPTNFDENKNSFDTSSIEKIIKLFISKNSKTTFIIKSTVPIGYTKSIRKKFKFKNIIFSPEFLREGFELKDNLYSQRFICSNDECKQYNNYYKIIKSLTLNNSCKFYLMSSTEAEATKLFSNTFLAMRVAFFNELDSFALSRNISSRKIIKAVSSDQRIGDFYNNPSFGFGGYCLPKDIRQLASDFKSLNAPIVKSISKSNFLRKKFLSDYINKKSNISTIGIYKLEMKKNSDNIRESAIIDVVENLLLESNHNIIIYDEGTKDKLLDKCEFYTNFSKFINDSDLILTNRIDNRISKYLNKVYTPDLFKEN